MAEETITPITVQVKEEDGKAFRLHQNVLSLDDENGKEVVTVSCGAGLGGDFVWLRYNGDKGPRSAVFHLRDVVADWVETFDPEAAKLVPRTRAKAA